MHDNFEPVSFEYIGKYRELLKQSGTRASDYSYGNIWGWAEHYGLEWKYDGQICWVRQTRPQATLWAPIGNWQDYDWKNCPILAQGAEFIRVPEELSDIWQTELPGRVEITETRGQWDYLYSVEELSALSGNRFHKKRNHVNQFRKSYDYHYADMTPDCVEAVLDMQHEWVKWREIEDSPSLQAEDGAIVRVLELWDAMPDLVGGVIWKQGEVIAYTVGEIIMDDTMVVHFEKGMTDFRGIYQAINWHFANAIFEQKDMEPGKECCMGANCVLYLNREQDLDDEGLRKAKESYNPVRFIKKNSVRILPR